MPALFAGVLRPLLQNWLFLDWDLSNFQPVRIRRFRCHGSLAYQPRVMIDLGRAWYQMPHRKDLLLHIGGGIIETLVADETERPFLARLRSEWVSDLNGEEPPEALLLLSEA